MSLMALLHWRLPSKHVSDASSADCDLDSAPDMRPAIVPTSVGCSMSQISSADVFCTVLLTMRPATVPTSVGCASNDRW